MELSAKRVRLFEAYLKGLQAFYENMFNTLHPENTEANQKAAQLVALNIRQGIEQITEGELTKNGQTPPFSVVNEYALFGDQSVSVRFQGKEYMIGAYPTKRPIVLPRAEFKAWQSEQKRKKGNGKDDA